MNKELFSALGGLFSPNFLQNVGKRQGEFLRRETLVDSNKFDYQIHVPFNAANTADLPLIVFLHGIRERGTNGFLNTEGALSRILKQYLKQVPAIVLLPQCRPGKYWSDAAMDKMVMQAIGQTVEEFKADAKRISLIGVSMGGYGVWHFAAQHPQKFAALVAICGGSPLLKGERFASVAEKIGKTPAWIFHGAEDNIVPVGESREMVKAIEANGGNVKYSEYAGVGHNVWLNALGEKQLLPWILVQRGE